MNHCLLLGKLENVKLKTANDLSYYIAQKIYKSIPYDWTSVLFWTYEDKRMSQTIYSPLINKTTVCAGYSQAYEMMCNGSGIEAVAVTSWAHEWNKGRVNDS